MKKRNIIIALASALAVIAAVTAIIAVSRKKSGDRITETGKSTSEYISENNGAESESKPTESSVTEKADVIDIGKDIEKEKEGLETEEPETASKVSGGEAGKTSEVTSSKENTNDSSKDKPVSKPESSSSSDSADKEKDSFTGWGAWE